MDTSPLWPFTNYGPEVVPVYVLVKASLKASFLDFKSCLQNTDDFLVL